MPFPTFDSNRKEYKKIDYLNLTSGTSVVRFIEDPSSALIVYSHYIPAQRSAVTCLGEDCPICKNNRKMIADYPDDFRLKPGYFPRSTKYLINVLDRTSVKVCPNCKTENLPPYSHTCKECNAYISEVKPVRLDKVKLLRLGNDLIHDLNSVEKSVCDIEGNPLGLMNYDIALVVEGTGTKKRVTPVPSPSSNEVLSISPEQLFNKEDSIIVLTPDEVQDHLRGVSLKDIFASRRLTKAVDEVKQSVAEAVESDEVDKLAQDVTDQINKLLG